MVEFEEVLGDFGDNVKKTFKDKKFLIAAVGVGVVALIIGLRKQGEEAAYEVGYPTGYSGYPTVGGGSSESSGQVEYAGYSDDQVSALLEQMDNNYSTQFDQMSSNISDLSDRLISAQEMADKSNTELERQKIISQMKANSEMYGATGDMNIRNQLHAQNLELGKQLGAEFDKSTGNYFVNGDVLYTTSNQQVKVIGGKTTAPAANVSYSNNANYQQQIIDGLKKGADGATINQLAAQRNAKIAATGATNANTQFDKNTDYAALIKQAKAVGADQSVINTLTAQREAKIASDPNLAKYK